MRRSSGWNVRDVRLPHHEVAIRTARHPGYRVLLVTQEPVAVRRRRRLRSLFVCDDSLERRPGPRTRSDARPAPAPPRSPRRAGVRRVHWESRTRRLCAQTRPHRSQSLFIVVVGPCHSSTVRRTLRKRDAIDQLSQMVGILHKIQKTNVLAPRPSRSTPGFSLSPHHT